MSLRQKVKGRRESDTFLKLDHRVIHSDEFRRLSGGAVKLLVEISGQYRGTNNGDMTTAWNVMKERGWKSRDTLGRAQRELERGGWIIRARQGGRNRPTLWALSFRAIDECNGKLDIGSTRTPPNDWRNQVP